MDLLSFHTVAFVDSKIECCVYMRAVFQVKVVSPKHRLIKVDSQEFGRCKVPLSPVTVQEEPVRTVSICVSFYVLLPYFKFSLV